MKTRSSLLITSFLFLTPPIGPFAALAEPTPERSITVHRAYIIPDESVRARLRGASGVRVFRLAFYEPGCAGDEGWAAKTVGCYSVRREHPVPSDVWKEAVKLLIADTRTYSTQFERECSGAPEYVVRLGTGREPVDAWICLECSQITLTVGSKMRARGGFDRVAGDLQRLVHEVVHEDEERGLPPWALTEDDFPLEGDTLPIDEAPALQGMNAGIRILSSRSPLASGERRARLRVDPDGTQILARVEEGLDDEERSDIERLIAGLVFTPGRRNGLPVSAWIEVAYFVTD